MTYRLEILCHICWSPQKVLLYFTKRMTWFDKQILGYIFLTSSPLLNKPVLDAVLHIRKEPFCVSLPLLLEWFSREKHTQAPTIISTGTFRSVRSNSLIYFNYNMYTDIKWVWTNEVTHTSVLSPNSPTWPTLCAFLYRIPLPPAPSRGRAVLQHAQMLLNSEWSFT